jgi:hypothetical protein
VTRSTQASFSGLKPAEDQAHPAYSSNREVSVNPYSVPNPKADSREEQVGFLAFDLAFATDELLPIQV